MPNNIIKHPGELLLSRIIEIGMKQKELAIRTGMSEKHISTVINGTKDISVSFGRKLDIALGDDIGTWSKLQAEYDTYVAAIEDKNGITESELAIFKSMKEIVDNLLKENILKNHCGDSEKLLQLRSFLRVNNLGVIPKISYNAAYRAQLKSSTNIDPYILFAWQRMCEELTDRTHLSDPFSGEKLHKSINIIKKELFEENPNKMINNLKHIFADCGIVFNVVRHFKGAPVQGFIKQSESGKVMLCLTIRGKKADRFWFSLFHEIGHLLNGDLSQRFVDFDSLKTESEAKADSYAREILINSEKYKNFISSENYNNLSAIKAFAKTINVPYWIVIGRLHNDEWLDWRYFANHIPSFEWNDE